MKLNVYKEHTVITENWDDDENQHITVGGHRAIDVYDPEQEYIGGLEKKQSPDKWRARKFIEFLGECRLTMEMFGILDQKEQSRLIKYFTENIEA